MVQCARTHTRTDLLLELAGGAGGEGQREQHQRVAGVAGGGQLEGGRVGAQQQEQERLPRRLEAQQPWFGLVGVVELVLLGTRVRALLMGAGLWTYGRA